MRQLWRSKLRHGIHCIIWNCYNSYSKQHQHYLATLYTAMLATAYYRLFWVGKISLMPNCHHTVKVGMFTWQITKTNCYLSSGPPKLMRQTKKPSSWKFQAQEFTTLMSLCDQIGPQTGTICGALSTCCENTSRSDPDPYLTMSHSLFTDPGTRSKHWTSEIC